MENQQTKRALTSSFGVTYYGEDSKENKALSVNYLESSLKISIHRPASGGDFRYDYKSGNEIYLREKSAKTLARFIKKAIEARDNQTDFPPVAVSSGNNLIEVSLGKHKGCNTDICVTIYNDIDAESKKCNNYATFGFRNTSYVAGYNPDDGSYTNEPIDADIDYFYEQLREFSKAASNAHAHMNKKEFKFDMDRIISRQLEVCNALGIKQPNINSSKVNWNNPDSISNSSGSVASLDAASILDELME